VQRRAHHFRLLTGARLAFADGTPDIVAYPEDRNGWGQLTKLLTLGNRRARKGECVLQLNDLLAHADGLLLIVTAPHKSEHPETLLDRLNDARPGAIWLGAAMHRRGDDRRRLARLKAISAATRTPLLAINDALYHEPAQRDLQDILTCIRAGVSIEDAGLRLLPNAERHLKAPEEMARLFADAPEALAQISSLLARSSFDLDQLRYEYPQEPIPPGHTAQGWLETLVRRRVPVRYPDGVPAKVEALITRELDYIARKDLATYFLTIHDIVLCLGYHQRRPCSPRPAVRALHVGGSQRAP
jgi:error-prone DNA polymerase